jgi:predicted RNA-binding protein with TRAM domain
MLDAAPGDQVRIEIDTTSGRSVFTSVSDPAFLGGLGAYRVAV